MTEFLSRAQVAVWLGVSPQKFKRMRAGELAAKNFPEPAFGTRQGERWDPEALKLWRRSQIPEHLRLATIDGDPTADAAELDQAAHALARGELH